jgi:hypothetical protein
MRLSGRRSRDVPVQFWFIIEGNYFILGWYSFSTYTLTPQAEIQLHLKALFFFQLSVV